MRFVFVCLCVFTGLIIVTSTHLYAQKEANIWYFGYKTGLDFRSGSPKVLQNGSINTFEGSASICDKQGNLLFYTDGVTLWDQTHTPMPNGKGLKGHDSSTQSAIIIPKPQEDHLYYVFTTDEGGYRNPPNDGVYYSEVNMCLNGGKGDVVVTSKNTFLYKPSAERLSAVVHTNGTDIWVMTHDWKANRFVAYLVTSQGVSLTPVISQLPLISQVYLGNIDNSTGEMKFSPDGTKLALAYYGSEVVQVMDFDALTGKVTLKTVFDSFPSPYFYDWEMGECYGLSFSPNSRFLYVASLSQGVIQFDATLPPAPMRLSAQVESANYFAHARGLQLGSDGKLYLIRALEDYQYLGVFDQPDEKKPAYSYKAHGIDLGLHKYNMCFPNFISSYFIASPTITANKVCETSSFSFGIQRDSLMQSVSWDFADPSSEKSNVSTQIAPLHEFSRAGEYVVKATLILKNGEVQTLQKKVTISAYNPLSLGKDTTLCPGQSLSLTVSTWPGVYRWQDGSSNPTLIIEKPGKYWVEICQGECSVKDTIEVSYLPLPSLDLGEDRLICDGKSITLKATTQGASYLWQDGSTQSELVVNQTGTYAVQVSSQCGSVADSVFFRYEQPPMIDLGIDQEICVGDTLWLKAEAAEAGKYLWYTLDSKQDMYLGDQFAITRAGTYVVEAIGVYCTSKDTLQVTFSECEQKVFIPNVITPNGDGKNDKFEILGIFAGLWSLEIYNKQGKRVYQSPHYQNDWQAQDLSSSIYYYYLYQPQSKRNYKGWIQILR